MPNIIIDPLSTIPLFLQSYLDSNMLGTGTGFIVLHDENPFLITNWHVLSGRNPSTNQPLSETGAVPDRIKIWHHSRARLGTWVEKQEMLIDTNGTPRWLEHLDGRAIDVVALPITVDGQVQVYQIDMTLAQTDLVLFPSEPVSIIGFPFGLSSAGRLPIWKTGHIASDIDINYDNKPVFIIDATTKPGMSGSPVVARRVGMIQTSRSINMGGNATRFLGIYSGRIHDLADIGMVWKPEVINSIIQRE